MPSKRVTITELARALGMSTTTVSVSLTGNGRVSEATRSRVLEKAAEMGYRALPVARHLRGGSTSAIGLYLPTRFAGYRYYMRFAHGVAQRARDEGLSTVLLAIRDDEPVHRLAFPVDGIIVSEPQRGDPVLQQLIDTGLPVVYGEGMLPGMPTPSGLVRSNHSEVFRQLLDQLVSAGAQSPVMLTPADDSYWAHCLRDTYRAWCEGHAFAHRVVEIGLDLDPATVRELVADYLDAGSAPDTVISSLDVGTSAVQHWASLRERQIGKDLLVAQCTDSLATTLSVPSITSIDLRPDELGVASTALLLDLLWDRAEAGTEREHHVVIQSRASSARHAELGQR